MKLTIENICNLTSISNHDQISVTEIETQKDKYIVYYYQSNLCRHFVYSIKRNRLVKSDIGWEGKLKYQSVNTNPVETYYLFKDDMLGPFNFMDFLNKISYEFVTNN
jgi:hypothetical protein